jgi:hypothetical protein
MKKAQTHAKVVSDIEGLKMHHSAGMSYTSCQWIHGSLVLCELCAKGTLQSVTDSLFAVTTHSKCCLSKSTVL